MGGKRIIWTDSMIDFAISNIGKMTYGDIAKHLIKHYDGDTRLTYRQVSAKLTKLGYRSPNGGRFNKGHRPWNEGTKGYTSANKTSFKKGIKPHNAKPVGSQRVCPKDGYILEKVAEPDVWQHKQRIVWEQRYGKIPDGHIIRFIDGDKTNIDIDNLMLLPIGAHVVINKSNVVVKGNTELNKAVFLTEKLRHQIRELTNG